MRVGSRAADKCTQDTQLLAWQVNLTIKMLTIQFGRFKRKGVMILQSSPMITLMDYAKIPSYYEALCLSLHRIICIETNNELIVMRWRCEVPVEGGVLEVGVVSWRGGMEGRAVL